MADLSRGFFSVHDQHMLQEIFKSVRTPVFAHLFTFAGSPVDARAQALYAELEAVVPQAFRVMAHHDRQVDSALGAIWEIEHSPTLVFCDPAGEDSGLRYVGLPSGYQISVVIGAVLDLARGVRGVERATVSVCQNLMEDVRMEVLVSPTCPHSPRVARLMQRLTLLNSVRLRGTVIDVGSMPNYAQDRGVLEVPHMRMGIFGGDQWWAVPSPVTETSWREQMKTVRRTLSRRKREYHADYRNH